MSTPYSVTLLPSPGSSFPLQCGSYYTNAWVLAAQSRSFHVMESPSLGGLLGVSVPCSIFFTKFLLLPSPSLCYDWALSLTTTCLSPHSKSFSQRHVNCSSVHRPTPAQHLEQPRSMLSHTPRAQCLGSCSSSFLSPASGLDANGALGYGRRSAHDLVPSVMEAALPTTSNIAPRLCHLNPHGQPPAPGRN